MTKLPHYVLPLYPAIAILIAGVLEQGGACHKRAGWCAAPSAGSCFPAGPRDRRRGRCSSSSTATSGCVAWPFAAAAVIFGLFAWWLYEVDGAERSLLRGMVASVFIAITVYAVTFPVVAGVVPQRAGRRRIWRDSGCEAPQRRFHRLLSGAEPGVPARHRYPLHRRRRRRRIPAQRRLPFCADRRAQRAQLRAARQRDRACAMRSTSTSTATTSALGGRCALTVFRSTADAMTAANEIQP